MLYGFEDLHKESRVTDGRIKIRLPSTFQADTLNFWASLHIRRAEACEKIFRQSKQKSARIVDPIRRIFVTISERSSGGKDSVKISCDEFLEVPF